MTLMFAVALVSGVVAADDGWELVKEDDNLKIYNRAVQGSSIREVRCETVIEAPVERVWAVLMDTSKYTEFMPYVLIAKRLGEHATGHYEYQMIDPPLVDKRDYAIKVTYDIDKETGVHRRRWEPANKMGPPLEDGVVRVMVNQGSWTLSPDGPKKTDVTYYLYTDPGGSIPAWIANKANGTSLPDLMGAVRNRSVNPAWTRD